MPRLREGVEQGVQSFGVRPIDYSNLDAYGRYHR
jgi:hypothetical protein